MNWWYVFSGSLVVLGIVLFFYFSTRRKYRDVSAAQNYEKISNKLTTRELEVEKEEPVLSSDMDPFSNITGLMLGIVVVAITLIIGVYILQQITTTMESSNLSPSAAQETLKNLNVTSSIFPKFFVILIGMIVTGLIFAFLSRSIKPKSV